MARATQFCIGLPNKAGVLAKLCTTLTRAKVNIEAISVADSTDCCWVRLVVTPAAKAKAALTKGKYNFCTQQVVTVKAVNKPGELGRIAAKLARAGVNINYAYGSASDGKTSLLVLSVSNMARASNAVGK